MIGYQCCYPGYDWLYISIVFLPPLQTKHILCVVKNLIHLYIPPMTASRRNGGGLAGYNCTYIPLRYL